MAIVPLAKVTLYGPATEKDAVLDGVQRLGCLHLNDLDPGATAPSEVERVGREARDALQYLEDARARRRAVGRASALDVGALVKEALGVRDLSLIHI